MPFTRGQSGNPGGRRHGSRNTVSLWLDRIASDQAADLLKILLRRARHGDPKAIAFVLNRIWPPRKGRAVRFPMPKMETVGDLPGALAAVSEAVSNGTLSPDEAASVAQVLNVQAHAVEVVELRQEVKEIERRLNESARSD
jgi:hypothetical protein